jgi:tetratricopeptide (TPR) repeat protein
MLVRAAEDSFRRGLEALHAGRGIEALALFEAALELEKKLGQGRPQARYLSYYGLCLAREGGNLQEGIKFCREAITLEFFNADLFWNLGRALLAAGRKKEAHLTFLKGLRLQRGHSGITSELLRLGIRRKPVLPFLSRSNPLNVVLGRLFRSGSRNGQSRNGESGNGTRGQAPREVAAKTEPI